MADKEQVTNNPISARSRSELAKHALAAGITVVQLEPDEEDPIDLKQLHE